MPVDPPVRLKSLESEFIVTQDSPANVKFDLEDDSLLSFAGPGQAELIHMLSLDGVLIAMTCAECGTPVGFQLASGNNNVVDLIGKYFWFRRGASQRV